MARSQMFTADKIWSRYSNDKVDIAHHLAHVIRMLNRSLPLVQEPDHLVIHRSGAP